MNERKRLATFVMIAAMVAAVGIYCTQLAFADAVEVEVEVEIMPHHLKLSTDAKPYINCHAWFPLEYDPADITDCSLDVVDTDVEAGRVKVCDDPQQAVALFDRATVCAILSAAGAKGNVELTMTMVLSDGTVLYGSDTIKVSK